MNSLELISLLSNTENIKKSRSGFFIEIKWEWQKKIWWLQKHSIYNIKAKTRYLFPAFLYTAIISFLIYIFLSFKFSSLTEARLEHQTLFDTLNLLFDFQNNYDQKWFGNYLAASAALFLSIFVYHYTLFNNKWKYAADLYNKLYIDQFNAKDQLDFFRKRCLLAQDVLKMNLLNHPTFCYETSQTIIMAYLIYEKLNNCSIHDTLKENESIQVVFLHKEPSFILRNVLIHIEETMYASSLQGSHSLEEDYKKVSEDFQRQYLLIQSLQNEIDNMKQYQNNSEKFAL